MNQLSYMFSCSEYDTALSFKLICLTLIISSYITFTFINLADPFIQSDLQMKTIEAIKPTKEQ